MSHKANEFDVIVVGSSLAGLVVATGLSQNQKVALVEKNELPGGASRTGIFPSVPQNPETDKAFDFLDLMLGQPMRREKVEQQPLTYEQGFKPFVGFGENAPLCVEELQYYLSPERVHLFDGPPEWIHLLYEKFRGEFINLSEVTKILIEENICKGLIINGQKQLFAKKVIFCCNPKELLNVTAQESLPSRFRQKISKSTLWTSVLLQLVHNEAICENPTIHMLGQKSEVDGFGLGQFLSPVRLEDGTVTQSSQWLTFVSAHDADDEELLGQTVRKLKKLIQKAFPNAFNTLKYEKIMVNPRSHGHIPINLDDTLAVEGIEGLHLVSAFPSELRNIPAALDQAERCLRSLGYCPAP